MDDTSKLGLPQAAHRLGVSIRVLRRAIRAGRLPAPPKLTAVSTLTPEWLADAQAAAKASPHALTAAVPPKVPPYARYQGTSAWHKHRVRVRAYARFRDEATRRSAAAGHA